MKIILPVIATVLVLTSLSQAQSPQLSSYDLKVDAGDIALIGEGLGMLPYSKVAPLMSKLQTQINAQQAKAETPVAPPAPPSQPMVQPKALPNPGPPPNVK